ncbi:isochorismatase family protein [Dunaliella salina]|uniref:Isochorismatase family protein n=1 Tax=Dunaliella salina TaxID=3046 RepID=A0ABQ7FXG9_DUNSA|nr:isochorismatase family protein [Dunaliella salina]|eukprot:KAF5827054.1 isochorismatase family protein [Dunaliella salina]
MQNYNCHPNGACLREASASATQYYLNRLAVTKLSCVRLQKMCRDAGVEVMFAVIGSLTQDGRDRSRDYKLSGFHCPKGSWDAQVIDELKPVGDEIVIPKTSSSVFLSTNLDYLLRSMGKTHVILCGALTDQCVCHATMDACDLHYSVTLVPECCATYSQERHDAAVSAIKGYCRQKNVEELEQELSSQVGNKQ